MFIVIFNIGGNAMWLAKDGFLYFNRKRATAFNSRSAALAAIKRTMADDKKNSEFSQQNNYMIMRLYNQNGASL